MVYLLEIKMSDDLIKRHDFIYFIVLLQAKNYLLKKYLLMTIK